MLEFLATRCCCQPTRVDDVHETPCPGASTHVDVAARRATEVAGPLSVWIGSTGLAFFHSRTSLSFLTYARNRPFGGPSGPGGASAASSAVETAKSSCWHTTRAARRGATPRAAGRVGVKKQAAGAAVARNAARITLMHMLLGKKEFSNL